MKTASLLTIILFSSFSSWASGLPPGYCYKKCDGSSPAKTPVDYQAKASAAGDPNTGQPLGPTMSVPLFEGGTKNVPSGDFFTQLNEFEQWTAKNCGESLADGSPVVQVAGPCYDERLKNTWTLKIKGAHSSTGTPPPNTSIIDSYFELAKAGKKKNDDFPWKRRGGQKTVFRKCWPKDLDAGTKDTFGIYLSGSACVNFYAPPLPSGTSVVKGVPAGSASRVTANGKGGVYILGSDIGLVRADATFNSPHGGAVEREAGAYVLGVKVWGDSSKGEDIKWDYKLDLGGFKQGVAATFTIGPIPITVEAGANANAQVILMARLTDMWANGRVMPVVDSAAYASGYINYWIAQAGIEATLTLLKDTLDLYGFTGVAVGNAGGVTQFVFTTQIAGMNTIDALSGHVDLFARIRVPKFIGWKWKTYSMELFRWDGVKENGYLFSYILANQPIMTFVNNEDP